MAKESYSFDISISDSLIRDINKGKFKADEKLPSENVTAERFGVPRTTNEIALPISCYT